MTPPTRKPTVAAPAPGSSVPPKSVKEQEESVVVDASSIQNKIMAGYQGWFGTPYTNRKWAHWAARSTTPNPTNVTFDMWPDTREYDADELCPTDFYYKNGSKAGLFSSYSDKTINRHVQWMRDYNIDGVYVQRFIKNGDKLRRDGDVVLNNIMTATERHGRVFANMYDVSGADADTVYDDLINDWKHLVDTVKVTENNRYLHHNNKPVLAIWGFGFKSRIGDPQKVIELMDWFQHSAEVRYQVTLMGGVPTNWRTLRGGSRSDPAWSEVYHKYDIISPWTVGRFANEKGADRYKETKLEPDMAECNAHGIDYTPVVFPGYSFHNARPQQKPFNEIKRNGGKFFWRQMYNARNAGCNQVYVAMFDEVDEGTAVFKVAENPDQIPVEGKFLTLDADGYNLPSDWYLQLMGSATKMLRASGTVPSTMPTKPQRTTSPST